MSGILVGVLADDLSGAADCAATFNAAGLAATVLIDREFVDLPDSAVMVLSSDTRDRDAAEAPERVAAASGELLDRSPAHLYKKVDSALRGHLAAELASMRDALGGPLAVCATAFPANGRVVRDGRGYVEEVPLEDSQLWRAQDLDGRADLPQILGDGGLAVELCGLEEVRAGGLAGRIAAAADEGIEVLVCDAETGRDLRVIVEAGFASGVSALWVGSAGLADALARHLVTSSASSPADRPPGELDGSILAVVGSASEVARAQAGRLAGELAPLEVAVEALLAGGHDAGRQLEELLGQGADVVLYPEAPQDQGPQGPLAVRLADALGGLVAAHEEGIGGFVLTGGATARAVLEACGVGALRIVGEVESGVPISLAMPGARPTVTKAGSFGSEETLLQACRALRSGGLPAWRSEVSA